jgi:flagellin-specific chaperone FliS
MENKNDSAIVVLDKCLEFFPVNKFPIDYYMIPVANIYYQAGAVEKGNTIVNLLVERYCDDLDYYNSLDSKRIKTFDQEMQQAIAIIQQLGQLAKQNKQTELSSQIDSVFYKQIEFFRH